MKRWKSRVEGWSCAPAPDRHARRPAPRAARACPYRSAIRPQRCSLSDTSCVRLAQARHSFPPAWSRARARAAHIAQLRKLKLVLKPSGSSSKRCSIEVIHHEKCWARQTRRRQVSRSTHPAARSAAAIPIGQRLGQHAHVGDRQIHALGAGRRHDVRGIAGQEQPPVLHRLDHKAAHGRDALLEDRPIRWHPAIVRSPAGRAARSRSARPATRSIWSSARTGHTGG